MSVEVSGTIYTGSSGSTTSLAINVTVPSGSDRLQTVGVSSYNAPPSSVVFNTTETHDERISVNSAGERATMLSRTAPTETTADVDVNFASAEQVVAGVINLTGADQTTPVTSTDSNSGASQTSTSITLTSETDGLCVDVITWFHATVEWSADGGQVEQWLVVPGTTQNGGGSTETGAASVTMTWTRDSSNGRIGHAGMAVAPAALTGHPPLSRLPRQAPFRSSLY